MKNSAQIRVLDGATVRALLPYDACIELMRSAMIEVSRGRAHMPLRQAMPHAACPPTSVFTCCTTRPRVNHRR